MHRIPSTPRRGFLRRVAAGIVAAGVPWTKLHGAVPPQKPGPGDWLAGLDGTYRCIFDSPFSSEGFPLLHIRNFMRTHESAYGTPQSAINVVGTLYFAGPTSSQPLAFNDAMWEKYAIGEYVDLIDPKTGQPTIRNMYYRPQEGDPIRGGASVGIESLQQRGVTFLTCANSLGAFAGNLAGVGHGDRAAIREDLLANLLPGVIVVPAMVIALERAQAAGFAYNRQ